MEKEDIEKIIRAMGMLSENLSRLSNDQAVAYSEKAFLDLLYD